MLDDKTAKTAHAHINPDGLTYRHKPGGSQFNGGSGLKGQAMSCLLCGRHRPRSMLMSRRLAGRHQVVCAPSCQQAQAQAMAQALGTGRVPASPDAVKRR